MTKITDENGISFVLNKSNLTAEVTISEPTIEDIFIPRAVKYQSQEYLITKIQKESFKKTKIKSVTFSKDSQIKEIGDYSFKSTSLSSITIPNSVTKIGEFAFAWCDKLQTVEISEDSNLNIICNKAFFVSHINELYIPSKLTKLEDEWCSDTPYLTNITLSPKNPNFYIYNKTVLIGKVNSSSTDFEEIKFVTRNATQITIPSTIIRISPFSFSECGKLHTIQFEKNSKLKEIGHHAFGNSFIKKFVVPSTVCSIGDHAFMECMNLFTVIFPNDFNIKTLTPYLFFNSSINQCIVPKNVSEIGESCFSQCEKLKFIGFDADDELIFRNFSLYKCKNVSMFCIENAKKVLFERRTLHEIPKDCILLCNSGLIIEIK